MVGAQGTRPRAVGAEPCWFAPELRVGERLPHRPGLLSGQHHPGVGQCPAVEVVEQAGEYLRQTPGPVRV
jgi:hypothetical protein